MKSANSKIEKYISREEEILNIIEVNNIPVDNPTLMRLLAKPVVNVERLSLDAALQKLMKSIKRKRSISTELSDEQLIPSKKSRVVEKENGSCKENSVDTENINLLCKKPVQKLRKRPKKFADIENFNKEINSILKDDIIESLKLNCSFTDICTDEAVLHENGDNVVLTNEPIPKSISEEENLENYHQQISENNCEKFESVFPEIVNNNNNNYSSNNNIEFVSPLKIIVKRKSLNCEQGKEHEEYCKETSSDRITEDIVTPLTSCDEHKTSKKKKSVRKKTSKSNFKEKQRTKMQTDSFKYKYNNVKHVPSIFVSFEEAAIALLPHVKCICSLNSNCNYDDYWRATYNIKEYLSKVWVCNFKLMEFVERLSILMAYTGYHLLPEEIIRKLYITLSAFEPIEEPPFLMNVWLSLKKLLAKIILQKDNDSRGFDHQKQCSESYIIRNRTNVKSASFVNSNESNNLIARTDVSSLPELYSQTNLSENYNSLTSPSTNINETVVRLPQPNVTEKNNDNLSSIFSNINETVGRLPQTNVTEKNNDNLTSPFSNINETVVRLPRRNVTEKNNDNLPSLLSNINETVVRLPQPNVTEKNNDNLTSLISNINKTVEHLPQTNVTEKNNDNLTSPFSHINQAVVSPLQENVPEKNNHRQYLPYTNPQQDPSSQPRALETVSNSTQENFGNVSKISEIWAKQRKETEQKFDRTFSNLLFSLLTQSKRDGTLPSNNPKANFENVNAKQILTQQNTIFHSDASQNYSGVVPNSSSVPARSQNTNYYDCGVFKNPVAQTNSNEYQNQISNNAKSIHSSNFNAEPLNLHSNNKISNNIPTQTSSSLTQKDLHSFNESLVTLPSVEFDASSFTSQVLTSPSIPTSSFSASNDNLTSLNTSSFRNPTSNSVSITTNTKDVEKSGNLVNSSQMPELLPISVLRKEKASQRSDNRAAANLNLTRKNSNSENGVIQEYIDLDEYFKDIC